LDRSGDDSAVIDWSAWYDGLVGIIGPQFFSRLGGFHAGLSCNVQYTLDSHGALTYTITKPSGKVMRSLDHQPILAFPVAESRRGSRVQSRRYAVSNTVVFKVPVGQTKDGVTHTKRYEMEYLDYRDGYWTSRVTAR
jgi:hypothetical protein